MLKQARRIGLGIGLRRSSKRVAVVLPAAPAVTVSPVISGTLFTNQTLSCTQGTWSNTPTGYTYQWKRNGVDIAGATAATYPTVDADAATTVTCSVTASNAVGNSTATATGVAVSGGPSNTVAPAVTGTAATGQTLTCSTGTWIGNTGNTYAYQWRRAGTNISGATASTYLLVSADAGQIMSCLVTATNAAGNASAASNNTAAVITTLTSSFLGSNVGAGPVPVTLAITPAPNSLLITTVSVRRTGTGGADVPSCVDDGGNTWTQLTNGVTTVTNSARLTQFRTVVGANPGTITISVNTVNGTGISLGVMQYVGASTDLSNVSPSASNTTGDPTATLPTAPSTSSLVLGGMCSAGSSVPATFTAGYTQLAYISPSGHRMQLIEAHTAAAGCTWASNGSESVGALVEIKQG